METIKELDFSMLRYNTIGMGMILLVFMMSAMLGIFVFENFNDVLQNAYEIAKSNKELSTVNVSFLIFIHLLRSSLLGAFIITLIVYSFKFANSAFDQAVRFNKRKHATTFLLHFIKGEDGDELDIAMRAFREWNINIESAFSKNGELQKNGKIDNDLLMAVVSKQEKNNNKER